MTDKSAMEQMVEKMKAELDGDLPREHRKAITPFYQIACRLLEQEQAQKPPADMAGLVEKEQSRERLAYCPTCSAEIKSTERRPDGDSVCVNGHKHKTEDFFRYRPSVKEEPLEELAKRKKGVRCIRIWPYATRGFAVDIDCDDGLHGHEGNTLTEAKDKARAFLNGLPDVNKGELK